MKTSQIRWSASTGWTIPDTEVANSAALVLAFADHDYFHDPACFSELRNIFPQARIVGCSSAGSVLGTSISDGDIVATAVAFENAGVNLVVEDVEEGAEIDVLAAAMVKKLQHADLRHVFVLSDGLKVNGSDLAAGLNSAVSDDVAATGGLAADGPRFGETWVMADSPAKRGRIAAIGFYGDLTVKCGCYAGWEEFGAERVITRSEANVVYEIDDQPALDLYKKYLGSQASELPASGLRFPLSVRPDKDSTPIIRTLLAVDESRKSLTFAGDVPVGHLCKLMKTNLDNLIDNAAMAAQVADPGAHHDGGLCLVVSCVGRRVS